MDWCPGIREEVSLFQASRAVVSTEIVDILAATGIQTPDISILSDEEITFSDAPAENESFGNTTTRRICRMQRCRPCCSRRRYCQPTGAYRELGLVVIVANHIVTKLLSDARTAKQLLGDTIFSATYQASRQ